VLHDGRISVSTTYCLAELLAARHSGFARAELSMGRGRSRGDFIVAWGTDLMGWATLIGPSKGELKK
jgi:hypothetical protein